MSDTWYHCAGCGRFLPAREIGITGRCGECWQKWLEENETRMKTIRWREAEALQQDEHLQGLRQGDRVD